MPLKDRTMICAPRFEYFSLSTFSSLLKVAILLNDTDFTVKRKFNHVKDFQIRVQHKAIN